MNPENRPIVIATRGSALALAQAHMIFDECRQKFPRLRFEIKIIKTTGDKMQTASMSRIDANLPRGLFTKELEVALLKGKADLAVHSLKDLPTDLPAGLKLGAITKRADVRDVLIYRSADYLSSQAAAQTSQLEEWSAGHADRRGFQPRLSLKDFPKGTVVATSSTRRKAQALALRPDFKIVEIRGNVTTRMEKLFNQPEIDAIILAAAGLERLNFHVTPAGELKGDAVPDGLLATFIDPEQMLPCVGQGALGIEVREHDERIATICERLNHFNTAQSVIAERAFLQTMGGGCQSAVAAYGEVAGNSLRLRAVSFLNGSERRGDAKRPVNEAIQLGTELAMQLKT